MHIALLLAVDGKKQESCTDKNDENFSPFPFNQFSLFCEKFLLIFIISLCPSRALLFLHPYSIPLCARYFLCLPIYIFDHFCLEELKVYPRWCTINILCSFFGVCLWFCMHTKCISGLLLLKISPWIHRERKCICAALCTFSRNNCHKQQQPAQQKVFYTLFFSPFTTIFLATNNSSRKQRSASGNVCSLFSVRCTATAASEARKII